MPQHVLLLVNTDVTKKDPRRGAKFRLHLKTYKERGLKVGMVAVLQRDYNLIDCLLRGGLVQEDEAFGAPIIRDCTYRALPMRSLLWRSRIEAVRSIGLRRVRQYIRRYGTPDVIHAHGSHWSGVAANAIQESLGIPYVVTEHMTIYASGSVDPDHMPVMRKVFAEARMRMPIGESTGRLLEESFGGDFRPWQVIPNMLDDALFPRQPQRPVLNVRPFVFISAGRFDRIKGFDVLLDAFAAKFKGQQVLLKIGGAGEEEQRLKAQAERLSLNEQVEFLGSLNRGEIGEKFGHADAYVLASRYETFGIPVVEAHASGLPVVATNCGVHENLIDESNGVWAEPDSADSLGEAMQSVRMRIETYDRDGIREACLATYSPHAVLDRLQVIYEEAINKRVI